LQQVTVNRLRFTKSSYVMHSFIVLHRIDWLMILTEINQGALQCKNKLPIPAL